jgi:ABC-2 type transport system ATP-binding protein
VNDAAPAVEARGLRKEFLPSLTLRAMLTLKWRRERILALDGLDLSLPPGRIQAFVGPNGAGKTTLLKLVAGLLLPSEGTVRVLGRDTARDPVGVRAAVGYCITDSRSFFLRLSGRENLRFFASLNGLSGAARDRRMAEVLDELELAGVADRRVMTYSEGMKQRLAIARALVHEPRVVLLDEVGRGLDPRLRAKVFGEIRDVLARRRGVTVLMASHAMDEVRSLADGVCVMDRGRVVAGGAWDDVRPAIDEVFGRDAVEG